MEIQTVGRKTKSGGKKNKILGTKSKKKRKEIQISIFRIINIFQTLRPWLPAWTTSAALVGCGMAFPDLATRDRIARHSDYRKKLSPFFTRWPSGGERGPGHIVLRASSAPAASAASLA
jgi:hypothetical protein